MFRKSVSALILNYKRELLIVNLNSFNESFFSLPGGGIDKDESPDNAIYREIFEELNILRSDLKFVGKSKQPIITKFKEINLNRDGINYEGMERIVYGFEYCGDNLNIIINKKEIRSYIWASLDKLNDYMLFDGQLKDTMSKIEELF